jgi:zinc transporter ZupT
MSPANEPPKIAGGDPRKRRNYVIAGSVGGFLLPLAGIIGALAFYQLDDREAARTVAIAAVAGALAWIVFLVGLG